MKDDANQQIIFLYQKQDAVKFKQTTCLRVRESIDNYGCDIILTFRSKFTSLLFVEVIIILGYIFRANKGLFINDIITRGARGKITNFLRDIYSQNSLRDVKGRFSIMSGDVQSGRPAMFYIFTWYFCPPCIFTSYCCIR